LIFYYKNYKLINFFVNLGVARVQAGTPMVVIKPTTRSAFTKRDISSPIQNRPLPLPPTGFENLTFDSHSPHQSEREPANDGAKKGNKLNEKKHQVTKKKPESKAKEQTQHKNKQEDIMEEVEFEGNKFSFKFYCINFIVLIFYFR